MGGSNVVAFEVAGYNVNSYSLLDQPSFLQAEVISDGKVLASTAGNGAPFRATILNERVKKVQRYSFQRPFSEAYRLAPGYDQWRSQEGFSSIEAPCAIQANKTVLNRRIPYPDYHVRQPAWLVSSGKVKTGVKIENVWKDRSLTGIGPNLGGYLEKDLELIPSIELQSVVNASITPINQPYTAHTPLSVPANGFQIVDFGGDFTGFIGADIECRSRTRLFFTFDEVLSKDDVDFKRLGCVNIIACELHPGKYAFESFEPNTLRYLKIIALDGDCEIRNIHFREYVNPDIQAQFAASDERFNRLFNAGIETFRQNALDIFMDCPSRERAGWLCDSFFTSRVAKDLSGNTLLEKNFMENFLLPAKFEHIPEGMLPMCYPADHNDGVFIPNWALWFVVELEEYQARSGDRQMVEALRPRVLRLLEYFKSFRNEDGLLEKLQSWVFVEWSKANDFVQDVNYPSNMLYAKALAAAAKLYSLPELQSEADKIRQTIQKQSFDGKFFVDNAIRKDGKLQLTGNHSEVCQYFAFFFDIATPESHAELWRILVNDFGPKRKQTKAFPEVHPANAFIGNVLRLELLSRQGLCQQLLDESLAYQLYMVEQTGTLWENDGAYASCNHGFASHGGVHTLYRDVLGLRGIDTVKKTVQLRFTDLQLTWCEGTMPTPDGPVSLRWKKDAEAKVVRYQVTVPAGYTVTIEKQGQFDLVRLP